MFLCVSSKTDNVEAELLHTFTKVYKFDTMLLMVRLAVLTAVTLTVPIVLFPVSTVLLLKSLKKHVLLFLPDDEQMGLMSGFLHCRLFHESSLPAPLN